ncbi:hypothetical protein ASB57_11330 [Bordetella sp. N]|nr:hypothetical protein ASB57_11330 [Bordetella sp. N]
MPNPSGMVSAPQPEAVDAGVEILRAGGNAVDAAIACALVQGVVDPLMSGIGGLGVMQVYDPKTNTHQVYEGIGGCPQEIKSDLWEKTYRGETTDGFGFIVDGYENECGARSVTAPAVLKLMEHAHGKLGKTDWKALFPAAIGYADKGWLVRPHVYTVFTQNERKYGRLNYGEKIGITEDGRRIYLDKDGNLRKPGERIFNPDLARTLQSIADKGSDELYFGDLARATVDDVRKAGGFLSMEDLAAIQVLESRPLTFDFRGWGVSVPHPPFGGVLVAQVLKIAEQFPLTELGHNSEAYISVLAEAMKMALHEKEMHFGDPLQVSNPVERVLSDASIEAYAERIRSGQKYDLPRTKINDSKHTTHVSVVDKDGMFVSFTHTLGNPSGFIVSGRGYMLNGAMSTYDPIPGRPNSIAPGRRRFSTMSPTLIFDGATPVATLGAPGASWIGPAVAQVILNLLEWGMDMQEAIMAPRMVATSNAIDISNRIPPRIQQQLEERGYEVRRTHLSYAFAGVHGISKFDGKLSGGADPQRDGYAGGA